MFLRRKKRKKKKKESDTNYRFRTRNSLERLVLFSVATYPALVWKPQTLD